MGEVLRFIAHALLLVLFVFLAAFIGWLLVGRLYNSWRDKGGGS